MDERSFHLIGIGGIGMSALARILLQKGLFVSGSDVSQSILIQSLIQDGAEISIGHRPQAVKGATVVYSTDIGQENVEFMEAKKRGLPLWHRATLLDYLLKAHRPLLVTGSHGKTTTTALLASVLLEAGLNPPFVVGGIVQALKTNGQNGKGIYFVAEADESDGSFLKTPSFGAIVTNCDQEHLAYWKSWEGLRQGFQTFFAQVQNPHHLFWCKDDEPLTSLHPPGYSYGYSTEADLMISNYKTTEQGCAFDFSFQGKGYLEVHLALRGKHNSLNGAAVAGLALSLGIEETVIRKVFQSFEGVKRRLEKKGERKGIQCYDDYGHHPTEIRATLQALQNRKEGRRLVLLFQPHRYTRTRDLWDEFLTCLEGGDLLFVMDVYSAGEPPIPGITGEALAKAMERALKKKVYYLPRNGWEEGLAAHLLPNDLLLTLGAGDVTQTWDKLDNWWSQN